MQKDSYKHELWRVKDELIDLIIKELDEENYFKTYFVRGGYKPKQLNIEQFANEVSNKVEDPIEMTYVYKFLMLSIHYLIYECPTSDWTFIGLNKMIKTTQKGVYEEESTFDILMNEYLRCNGERDSLLKKYLLEFRQIEQYCHYPKWLVNKLPIYIYEWRDEKEEKIDTGQAKLEKVQKVLEFAKKTFQE